MFIATFRMRIYRYLPRARSSLREAEEGVGEAKSRKNREKSENFEKTCFFKNRFFVDPRRLHAPLSCVLEMFSGPFARSKFYNLKTVISWTATVSDWNGSEHAP